MPIYNAMNDPNSQIGGLLSGMNPQDLSALRMMPQSSDPMGTWQTIVQHLTSQGLNPDQVHQIMNSGWGASGNQALGGNWQQQMQQQYGQGNTQAAYSGMFGGSDYSGQFNAPKPMTTASGGVPGSTMQGDNFNTGRQDDPTNGTWDVNGQYKDANLMPTPGVNNTGAAGGNASGAGGQPTNPTNTNLLRTNFGGMEAAPASTGPVAGNIRSPNQQIQPVSVPGFTNRDNINFGTGTANNVAGAGRSTIPSAPTTTADPSTYRYSAPGWSQGGFGGGIKWRS